MKTYFGEKLSLILCCWSYKTGQSRQSSLALENKENISNNRPKFETTFAGFNFL